MHTGFGDRADGVKIYPSAGLEFHGGRTCADGLTHIFKRHIVEQDDIHSHEAEKAFGLPESVGLQFHTNAGIGRACLADHSLERFQIQTDRKMVVLHHEHIVEAHPVIARSSCGNSGFF